MVSATTQRIEPGNVAGAAAVHLPAFGFLSLLVAELLYLTLTLDTQRLDRIPSTGATVVGWSPQLLRLTTTVVLVAALLGGRALWTTWAALAGEESRPARSRAPFVALHFLSLVLFAWVSSVFFSGQAVAARAPALWAMAWFASGTMAFLSWSHSLLPLGRWRQVLTEHRSLLACSGAVGTVAWAFGFVSEAFWEPLARYTYQIVGWTLGQLYGQVVSNPTTLELGTSSFSVIISPQCSGYEGIGLIVGFLSIYLFFFRRELRFPAALVLLPLGAVMIWILNSARIIALIAIGHAGWEQVAVGGFHSQAGWLAFNAVGLGFVALMRRGRFFAPARAAAPADAPRAITDTTTPYLAPFLALLAAAMVTGAMSAGFDWLYPVRLVVLGTVLWACRQTYATLNWTPSWVGGAVGVAAFALWMALLPAGMTGKEGWPAALQSAGSVPATAWLLARTFGYVIAVPLAEELVFRGYLTRRFWRPDADAASLGTFTLGGLVISSAVFGAFHGPLWLAGTLAGMLFAFAFYRRRSMGDAVLAHATTNGLIALYVFMTGQWSVWS
jgi:exosortase E/protease (VPEID-CTERM system)